MNKLNIVPGFKEGGVASVAKELESIVTKKPTVKLNDKQVMEEVAEIAQKVPADAYKGLYMTHVNVKPHTKGVPDVKVIPEARLKEIINGAEKAEKKADVVVDIGVGKKAIEEGNKRIAELEAEGKTVAIRRPWLPDYQGE